MRKLLIVFFIFLSFAFMQNSSVLAEEFTLQAGVSLNDVPKALFGSWRVSATLEESNSYGTFKPQSIDFWTLSRIGDKITLSNPFSGANADISVKTVEGNLIVFSKKAPYDNKMLTDTITIRLSDSTFTGINTLSLESFSLVDNHLMKTETARYVIKGEKISGDSILGD